MGLFTRGTIVVVPFPFSDLTQTKRRPAVILAEAEYGDYILCQITSKSYSDSKAIKLGLSDFVEGGLKVTSYVRPAKIFTASSNLIIKSVGKLNSETKENILLTVRKIFED